MVRTLRTGKTISSRDSPIPRLESNEVMEAESEVSTLADDTLQHTISLQLGSDLGMEMEVYEGQGQMGAAIATSTNPSTINPPSSLNIISDVENVRHDHNLAKNSDKNTHKNIQLQEVQAASIPSSQEYQPQSVSSNTSGLQLPSTLQNIIFTSLDGKPLTMQQGCQFIQVIPNMRGCNANQLAQTSSSMAPFVLPPGYQMLNIPPTLSSMLTSDVPSSGHVAENETIESVENSEILENHANDIDSSNVTIFKEVREEPSSSKKRKRVPNANANPIVTVQTAEGESVTLQRFYFQTGLCRVCLLAKTDTISIFEDVNIDDNGMIENSRGPYPVRYHIIPAIKTLLDVEVVWGDGLPDQICMDCLDNLMAFSAFRKKTEIGQSKFNEIISQVKGSVNPTFLPAVGESDFGKTGIFKHHDCIVMAKELLTKSEFSHMVERSIPDRVWDKIFTAMSSMVGYKSGKLKYIEHYAHSPPYISGWFCYTCNITIHDTKEGYAQHFQNCHEITSTEELRYPCDICGVTFPISDSSGLSQNYGEHWIQHFFFHKCNICSKKMPSTKGLWIHKKSAHNDADKVHRCDICDKSFSKKAHLECHTKIHLNADQRKQHLNYCSICGKGLTGSISTHMQTVHNEDRKWKCEICEKTFKRKEILNGHRESVHLQIKKYQCEVCGEFLKSHATKVVHLLRHKGEKPFLCDADGCNKRFYSLHSLKSHKIKHKAVGDIECTECGKVFKRKMTLVEHMLTHSGALPHECPICGRQIRMKSNYFKHLKVHKRKNEGIASTQDMNTNFLHTNSKTAIE